MDIPFQEEIQQAYESALDAALDETPEAQGGRAKAPAPKPRGRPPAAKKAPAHRADEDAEDSIQAAPKASAAAKKPAAKASGGSRAAPKAAAASSAGAQSVEKARLIRHIHKYAALLDKRGIHDVDDLPEPDKKMKVPELEGLKEAYRLTLHTGDSLRNIKTGYYQALVAVERASSIMDPFNRLEGLVHKAQANEETLEPVLEELAIEYDDYMHFSAKTRLLMTTAVLAMATADENEAKRNGGDENSAQ